MERKRRGFESAERRAQAEALANTGPLISFFAFRTRETIVSGDALVITLAGVLIPLFMVFVLPPSCALALQIPGVMAIRKLGLSFGSETTAMVVSILVAWFSIALPVVFFAYILTSTNRVVRLTAVGLLIAIAGWSLITGRSQKQRVYVGTYQHGFERSDFYPNWNCWRPPYWMDGFAPALHGFGNHSAVRVTFVGDATSLSRYGHLGAYVRAVRVSKVISVEPLPEAYGSEEPARV
jgi:hypothetical protein